LLPSSFRLTGDKHSSLFHRVIEGKKFYKIDTGKPSIDAKSTKKIYIRQIMCEKDKRKKIKKRNGKKLKQQKTLIIFIFETSRGKIKS
jgi:hypothetical protein